MLFRPPTQQKMTIGKLTETELYGGIRRTKRWARVLPFTLYRIECDLSGRWRRLMPQVFRIMREDGDGWPNVASSANGLGVRPGRDIDVDSQGNVLTNGKGMSVNPSWQDAPLFRIPERLRHLKAGARGPNSNACFRHGSGPFSRGEFAEGLTVEPDSPTHALIVPNAPVPLADYEAALAATRSGWEKDEG